MRVTTSQIYNNLLTGIRSQLNIQNQGNAQVASGTRFQTPAQAGIDYKVSLDIRSNQVAVKGSLDAITTAESRLNMSQTMLNDINILMTRAETIAVQQSKAGLQATDRAAAATEVGALLDRFLYDANTQWQGQSLFGGTAVNQAAFVTDAFGAITYNGNAQDRLVAVTADHQLASNVRGDDPAFINAIQALQGLHTALQNNDLTAINTASANITTAGNGMIDITAKVGGMLSNIITYKTSYQDMQAHLDLRLNTHEAVDIPAVVSQMQQASTALQAAYGQVAKLGSLSLTQYL